MEHMGTHLPEDIQRRKEELAKEIGDFYATYLGPYQIEGHDGKLYRYETVDELLKDWLNTLVEDSVSGGANWEKEICFIVLHISIRIKNISPYRRKNGRYVFMAAIDARNPKNPRQTKQLSCGNYSSIINAIRSRDIARGYLKRYNDGKLTFGELQDTCAALRKTARTEKFENIRVDRRSAEQSSRFPVASQ